ncbi:MAG: carbohydrate-binding family 9-like protein [Candidatus Latescibacterota bacterium]|nr:MAG: carbohydrate-binding family 9-like protein [Candidatus Latescibacterota bacterium]
MRYAFSVGLALLWVGIGYGRKVTEPKIPFSPRHYVCYRVEGPITVDGKLDEPSWRRTPWTEDFVDIEGELKPRPRFRTRAKMLWDDVYFYVGAELEEPDVWATLTRRDTVIFLDNDFEVFIDPDGDTHRYYELEVNALGTEWDLFLVRPYRDGGPPVISWDIQGLKTGVHVEGTINTPGDRDEGWTVEIALPWDVLKECALGRRPPQPGDQWRVNFSRVEWRVEVVGGRYRKVLDPETGRPLPEDNWVWSPQGLINMHYPEMWGYVQFSDKVVGTGEEKFVRKPEETAKWALRMVYYRQWAYREEHGMFAEDVGALGLENLEVEGYRWPPKLGTTWSLFEAVLESEDGKERWHIRQDGLVWKE